MKQKKSEVETNLDLTLSKALSALDNTVDELLERSKSPDPDREIEKDSRAISACVNATLKVKDDMRMDLEKAELSAFKDQELLEFIVEMMPSMLSEMSDEEVSGMKDVVDMEVNVRKVREAMDDEE